MTYSSQTSDSKPDRLSHSLVSQGGAQVVKLLVSIGIGGWTARYLGPQNLGTLSYVTALVGLLGPFGSLGVKGSLSAMLCQEQPFPGLLGSALLIELVGTMVIALMLIPFAWTASDPVVVGLIGIAVVGNLLGSSEVFEVELLNRQRGTELARLDLIQTIAGAFFSVFALLIQAPLLVFGSLALFQSAIRCWLLAIAVQALNWLKLLKQASRDASLVLIKRGLPLLLAGMSVTVYMRSDQVMLQWLRGSFDLGQYSIAVKVAESLYFIPVVLSSTFLPRIARGSGRVETDSALRQLYQCAWILGLLMLLSSIFLLPLCIPLVFGDRFLPAQSAVVWLGPASFAVATGCASDAWLNTQGHQKLIAKRCIIGALINIVMNLFLIPGMGFAGAAFATSIAQICAVFLVGGFQSEIFDNIVYLAFPFRCRSFQR